MFEGDLHVSWFSFLTVSFVVASSGRLDRVFQILPEQESMMSVGDMLSDGILVVEFESPSSSPYGESTWVWMVIVL